MNKKQKKVILIGLIFFVLMGLFPPWIDHIIPFGRDNVTVFVTESYGFLFVPPRGVAFVDLSRLIVQWLLVIAVTVWMVYLKGDKNQKAKNTTA